MSSFGSVSHHLKWGKWHKYIKRTHIYTTIRYKHTQTNIKWSPICETMMAFAMVSHCISCMQLTASSSSSSNSKSICHTLFPKRQIVQETIQYCNCMLCSMPRLTHTNTHIYGIRTICSNERFASIYLRIEDICLSKSVNKSTFVKGIYMSSALFHSTVYER